MTIKNLKAKDVNAVINKIPDVREQEALPYLTKQIDEYSELVERQSAENEKLMTYCQDLVRSINAKL